MTQGKPSIHYNLGLDRYEARCSCGWRSGWRRWRAAALAIYKLHRLFFSRYGCTAPALPPGQYKAIVPIQPIDPLAVLEPVELGASTFTTFTPGEVAPDESHGCSYPECGRPRSRMFNVKIDQRWESDHVTTDYVRGASCGSVEHEAWVRHRIQIEAIWHELHLLQNAHKKEAS